MTNRYNLLEQLNKGLRAFMYETATRLQQSELSDLHGSAAAVDQIENLVECFQAHADYKHTLPNLASQRIKPDALEIVAMEWGEDGGIGAVMISRIAEWRAARDARQRRIVGRRLQVTLNEYIASSLTHMNRAEAELGKALENASGADVQVTARRFFETLPNHVLMTTMKWMLRGISDTELTNWITHVMHHAPSQLYAILISMAEHELEPSRWARIEKALDALELHSHRLN